MLKFIKKRYVKHRWNKKKIQWEYSKNIYDAIVDYHYLTLMKRTENNIILLFCSIFDATIVSVFYEASCI